MTSTIIIREYKKLKLGKNTAQSKDNRVVLSKKDFNFLQNLNNQKSKFLQWYYKEWETDKKPPKIVQTWGQKSLRIQNYVGVVRLPSGVVMEILPKVQITADVFKKNNNIKSEKKSLRKEKQKLIDMIVSTLVPRISEISAFKDKENSLMEYIIWWFLKLMDDVVKKGIKQNYVLKQENRICHEICVSGIY